MSASLSARIAARTTELNETRTPYVHATVVRAQCPTAARPGDSAIVLADGSIEGFVGGQCAESSVRVAALDALASGEAILLRVLPEPNASAPSPQPADQPGARTVVNPCLSGGALEIFLEPKHPAARLVVIGTSPIAAAIGALGAGLGFAVDESPIGPGDPAGATAVIVATHGRGEAEAIKAALHEGVGFVGLVASHRRGTALLDELQLDEADRARLHVPVGLPIGAKTAEEVALSALAEVVRAIRVDGLAASAATTGPVAGERPSTATDPVCGMTVVITEETPHLKHDGEDLWFCNPGCRARFLEERAS
jgi:xanthine dehydrogenase accessory factor